MDTPTIRLTQFSHGGGCGCKISPAILQELLAKMPQGIVPPNLLIGTETGDDAAVYRLNDSQALVATTDFFMPIVDDPYDFGAIAATNALSDVYAMGGTPILALALVGMPIQQLPLPVIGRVLEGGSMVCKKAGIPVAGGHSIDSVEPIYGLVALGLVHPQRVKSNKAARQGDVLILGKPLGIGILSAAEKSGKLERADYQTMIEITTQLNRVGQSLGECDEVHAMTDVTGFGLLGHLMEMCVGSNTQASLSWAALPLIAAAQKLAQAGVKTGASARNWAAYGDHVSLHNLDAWQQHLLTDPQTSGGLLVSCAPASVDNILKRFHEEGFRQAAIIGTMQSWTSGARIIVN
ncbi:MAG: selenide, water dikinase SelD [Burkholderiales bacterium]|jgi:selenide,water dikinase|nr:selenide, water dikinase SelD [Burkholderiales bacterium]